MRKHFLMLLKEEASVMHVLIVSQYFWPEAFPINDVAAGLAAAGHKVTVLTGIPNYPEGKFYKGYHWFKPVRETRAGINIARVPLISRGKSKGLRLALNYLSYVVSGCLLAPFLCREKYDVMYVYGTSPITQALPALWLKWLRKIPVVLNVQDLWPESLSATGVVTADSWVVKWVGKLVQFIYSRCDKILVQSRSFVASIKQYKVSNDKLIYLPNFISGDFYPATVSEHASERKLLPTGFIVMFAGNLGVAQDLPAVIAAAEILKTHQDIHFVLLGDGRNKATLEALVADKGLNNVHFLGRYPAKQMPHFFALADALLMSLCDEPIFALTIPSKLQAYMACGRPILAMLNGEGANIVAEADAGLVIPAGDAAGLAKAVLLLQAMDADHREQFGQNALQYSRQHFDRDRLLQQLTVELEQSAQKGV